KGGHIMTPDSDTSCLTPRLHRNQFEAVEKPSCTVSAPDMRHAARGGSLGHISRIPDAPVSSASHATRRLSLSNPSWRLGLVMDRDGHIHLGVVVANTDGGSQPRFIELLAPVGAAMIAESDVSRMMVLVHGDQLASLGRIVD